MSIAAAPSDVEGSAGADLAVVVISLRSEPGLVDAVRSLIGQDPRPEIMVVNTGGGDPGAALRGASLRVPVIDRSEPLFPGAARNLGVRATRAPFVGFLAADCQAEPGWVAGRVRRHRDGADAVASVMTNASPGTATGTAAYLLLWARRMASTPARNRVRYGLSYARSLLETVGPFREDLRQGEDTELNERLGPGVTVEWGPEVRTTHQDPLGPWQLVRDQYARGCRSPVYDHVPIRSVLRIALMNRPLDGLRWALRAGERGERLRLLAAAPLLVAASIAFALGIIRSRLDGPSATSARPLARVPR
jgi:glycosyltransferase involved in cell wall biosynthesis